MRRKRTALFFAILALLSAAPVYSLFLVGEAQVGKETPVLCEGQQEIYVSSPQGSQRLELDSSSQASFTPASAGPYTVQCGNETKTLYVAGEAATAAEAPGQADSFIVAAVIIFLVFSAGLAAVIAKYFIFGRAAFEKKVENGRAELLLRPGHSLEKISITDPVSFGFAGKPLEFALTSLSAGQEWRYCYEIDDEERALPASLEAVRSNGKRVHLLSSLYIEGKMEAGKKGAQRAEPKMKKELPRAK